MEAKLVRDHSKFLMNAIAGNKGAYCPASVSYECDRFLDISFSCLPAVRETRLGSAKRLSLAAISTRLSSQWLSATCSRGPSRMVSGSAWVAFKQVCGRFAILRGRCGAEADHCAYFLAAMDAKAHGVLARGKPRSVSTTSGGFFAGGWGTPLHAPHFFIAAERRSFGRRAARCVPQSLRGRLACLKRWMAEI